MLSTRSVALLLVAAAVASAVPPTTEVPNRTTSALPNRTTSAFFDFGSIALKDFWQGFPFINYFPPISQWFPNFSDLGPKIKCDDDKFQVDIAVKNYEKDNIKVKVKNSFLSILATQESNSSDHNLFASQFYYSYTLPDGANGDDVTAEISNDGWLTVGVPIKKEKDRKPFKGERTVEVIETGKPYSNDDGEKKKATTAKPEIELNDSADRAEPTTPRDREEITENMIPNEKDKYKL